MQIKSIHKMQDVFDKVIKLAKFTWRHFFVCCVFSLLLMAYIYYPAINWELFGLELVTATFLDWFKTKIKLSNTITSTQNSTNSIASFSESNYWNSEIVGTASYLSTIGNNFSKYR